MPTLAAGGRGEKSCSGGGAGPTVVVVTGGGRSAVGLCGTGVERVRGGEEGEFVRGAVSSTD